MIHCIGPSQKTLFMRAGLGENVSEVMLLHDKMNWFQTGFYALHNWHVEAIAMKLSC